MKNLMSIIVVVIIIMTANQEASAQSSFSSGSKALSYREYKQMKKDLNKELAATKTELRGIRFEFQTTKDSTFVKDIEIIQNKIQGLEEAISSLDKRMTLGETNNSLNVSSISSSKGVRAYSVAKQADANYEISQSIARSIDNGSAADISETGLSGIVVNGLHRAISIDVYNSTTKKLVKSFYLDANSTQAARLLPGTYYTVLTVGNQKAQSTDFLVDGTTDKYYKGLKVAFRIVKDTY